MANNCSVNIKPDKLPIVLKKVEFYVYRAVERSGMSFLDLPSASAEFKLSLLSKSRELLEADILNYSKKAAKLGADTENGKAYLEFASNLQGINANWDEATAYFSKYFGGILNLRTRFKLDQEGLIDLDETADEEEAFLTKYVFDQPANEVDPVDNIDKGIELFLRSLKREGVYDDYGFNVLVDYGSFVRRLSTDLENTVTIDQIVTRLDQLKSETPEYQVLLDKLTFKPTDKAEDLQFKINFRNSFAKALIPIYVTSFENGTVKVIEATVAKRSLYEQIINSNFLRRGMLVTVNGKKTNLAHQEGSAWVLSKEDAPKIQRFMDERNIPAGQKRERQIQFLEGLGFEFSEQSRDKLLKAKNIDVVVDYIYKHLMNVLESGTKVKEPIKAIGKTVYINGKPSFGQKGNVNTIIEFEVKYNRNFNVERSMINQDGNRQHAIQNHNNFTIINKYLSDSTTYPTLQSIIAAEPSLFWLDPVKNPSVANSLYLNSLFFFSPQDPNFGARRRVVKKQNGKREFSATEGEFVEIKIVNTGGIQVKNEMGLKTDSAGSTSMESGDKLVQDINTFISKGFTSIQRLSDKSTDLGIYLNFYVDPVSGAPIDRILGGASGYSSIYATEQFIEQSVKALKDVLKIKFLASKGFYSGLSYSGKSITGKNNFGIFDDILTSDTKEILNLLLEGVKNVEDIDNMLLEKTEEREIIAAELEDYMMEYSSRFKNILKPITSLVPTANLFGTDRSGKARDLNETIDYYLANTFLSDIENLKVFFGESIFFKQFHKRSSKDAATGIFTTAEDAIIEKLNDYSDAQGYGANTNLSGRMLIERLFQNGVINKEQRDQALMKQLIGKTFKSAVINDVMFDSRYISTIKSNIEKLYASGNVSKDQYKLYKESLEKVISDKYKGGTEGDGQGKVTFDFYRTMSILTSNWGPKQEEVYKKIVMYSHYQDLIETEQDEAKRAEYVILRDAVGYDPLEQVYFPPKKFQYTGPMEHLKQVLGEEYGQMVPVFDKFSLQPLIPTLIKGTADEQLAKRMEFNGISYVKFESGSKAETPSAKDDYYAEYNPENTEVRKMFTLEQLIESGKEGFKSEQTLFMGHLKDQVRIDNEVHEDTIFGSQIRKLLLLNILGSDTNFKREEFTRLYDKYVGLISALIKAEKRDLYSKMGVRESANHTLSVSNIRKLVDFFFTEIDKKNQDSNVRKALKYNEQTGQFEIPLDGAVQAQIIEGIIISSINNRIVRHRSNGSMLTQVSITGSDRIKSFDKAKSKEALDTFGNTELQYYTVTEENGKQVVTAMQVKIGLTRQWLPLLKLQHPDGSQIGTLERLNSALKDENWKKANRDSIRLGAYRIPTQGLNFMEVMEVAEFLPAAFGDAIILPSEIVIKSGSDFDIDKLFVFYPNLVTEGDNAGKPVMIPNDKKTIENELFKTMFEIALHPANYIQLITPSEQFHILPVIDKVYEKIYGTKRQKTDYKNTQLIDRDYNMRKYLSLLKGKSDLGIAAIANTFNVLFQLVGARASADYLRQSGIRSFFETKGMEKSPSNNVVGINYADIYDEDGVFKSEFFAEFISAFVDVAKDDYVFAVNVVTELSPVIFYMKYMGLSTDKIITFINQPAIRNYTKNLSKYENTTVKSYLEAEKIEIQRKLSGLTQAEINEDDKLKALDERLKKLKYSTRKKALSETMRALGFSNVLPTRQAILKRLMEGGRQLTAFNKFFTADTLTKTLKSDEFNVSELSDDMKLVQLAMLFELENLKLQSDSLTDAQRFLNFDTKPYKSVFDVYLRNEKYTRAKADEYILSSSTVERIRNLSPIAPLNADQEIKTLASSLFPVRNNESLNAEILNEASEARANINVPSVRSESDMETFARTFRNDLMSFILYNYLDKSEAGSKFFKEQFGTDKTLPMYVKELIETPKLLEQYNKVKDMDDYQALVAQYPFIQNIIIRTGDRNANLLSFKLVESSSHAVDKESVISQFEEVVNLSSKENEDIRMFFRNLALYSTFQSGYNYGEFSYTAVTPEFLINKLYGEAAKEFMNLSEEQKSEAYQSFKSLFVKNNPLFYEDRASYDTPTNEPNKRGKWYAQEAPLDIRRKVDVATIASKNPLVAAGVRPSDMAGNAAKDITMADQATQFIGFKSGEAAVSSTDRYRIAWGEKANTGKYTDKDVVMVSASGTFRGVTREQVIQTFDTKYQSILDKAIAANSNFVVGNRYDKGNLGDFLVADYLRKKGYIEQKFDGYSKWVSKVNSKMDEFAFADMMTPIEQNFADGSAGRRMRPEFAGKSTMDLIISGDRTRTTRSKTEIARMISDYKLGKISELVGKVIRMTDKKGNMVYTRITKVSNFTKEYQDKTWMKEGWIKEVTDKLVGQYPYAIEFEVVSRPNSLANADVSNPNISTLENKINAWIEKEIPWSIETPASELAKMYEAEKLQDESVEEFLHRLSCKGKLK